MFFQDSVWEHGLNSENVISDSDTRRHPTQESGGGNVVPSGSLPRITSPLPRLNSQPVQFMMVDFGGATASQNILELFHVTGVEG